MVMKHKFVKFYRRRIDDAFVVFKDEGNNFQMLQDLMNDFGPEGKRLEWVATKPTTSVAFLDVTVRITDSGEIATATSQKTYNLYLYRPPTSAQPESILYSLIYGTIHR